MPDGSNEYSGNLEMVKLLLARKADVNINNDDGDTPLQTMIEVIGDDIAQKSVHAQQIQIIKSLVNAKADVKMQNDEGAPISDIIRDILPVV